MRRPRPPAKKLSQWQASEAFRAMGSAAISEYNKRRRLLLKCGAARKSDGEPCQQIAMGNGRCHYHGGRVPRGKDWHRHQWPDRYGPAAEKRMHDKHKQIERQQKARAKRLAAMPPAERAVHDAWHKTHAPGSKAKRDERRRQVETAAQIQELMAKPEIVSPEVERLRGEIERRKLAILVETLFA